MITMKKVLIPTDFSDCSHRALQYGLAVAEKFQAKPYIIHVWELPMTGGILPVEPYPEMVFTEEQKAAKQRLTRLTDELKTQGIDAEPVFAFGRPYVEIVKAVANLEADLVVLATHGRGGIGHLLLGSVAEKVVRLAPCPVLTVRTLRPVVERAA
jgi:nucleotide-binding universal stress UspA family protein